MLFNSLIELCNLKGEKIYKIELLYANLTDFLDIFNIQQFITICKSNNKYLLLKASDLFEN